MHGQPTAILMAREATRRRLTEPPREGQPRVPRRTTARLLAAAAHRLDPRVAQAPRPAAG
jgi:hypothetical protein